MSELVHRLSRFQKRLILGSLDFIFAALAYWLAFVLRLEDLFPPQLEENVWLLLAAPLLAVPAYASQGLYSAITRHISTRFLFLILKSITLSTLLIIGVVLMSRINHPRSVFVIYFGLVGIFSGGLRLVLRMLLPALNAQRRMRKRIVIYGAGESGVQLAKALIHGNQYTPVAFVDDSKDLHGCRIMGLKVLPAENLDKVVAKQSVDEIVLCMPSMSRDKRRALINTLIKLPVKVKTLPSITNMVSGEIQPEAIREVQIEDVLGRDQVLPNQNLMEACIAGKSILVSGAGGSIGSELCRQILRQQPACLVLFELCEYNLYAIERELRLLLPENIQLIPVLGSVMDKHHFAETLKKHGVQTVYHAAAYKHVPLVEANPAEAVKNNIFGTLHAVQAAIQSEVERFILISTDKAVRPTSVMGMTKRFAELILQGLNQKGSKTILTMVRFGNVLGSSGSVIPLFKRQIKAGGPVTVTHPEVTRYFMTIPEAAQLVIQAGALASGGDVFLLDMGSPIRIIDLARKMIRLSGYTPKDKEHPNGDIEISIVGLRPGEKKYEELLIGDDPTPTEHPRIMRASECLLPWSTMEVLLRDFEQVFSSPDGTHLRKLLKMVAENDSEAIKKVVSQRRPDDKQIIPFSQYKIS